MTADGSLVLFSGGLDSTVCLSFAQRRSGPVLAVLFDYGQKSRVEIDRANRIAAEMGVELLTVPLDLSRWGGSKLFDDGCNDTESTDPDAFVATDYVPARNLVFLSIATGIAEARGLSRIYIGANASEQTFRDARPQFFDALQVAITEGTRQGKGERPIRIAAPLAGLTKEAVVQAGITYGAPLHLTWSCYDDGERPCGTCQSCLQRGDGFRIAGFDDPALTAADARAAMRDRTERSAPHHESAEIVQIVGTSSSGSTRLALWLAEHDDVEALGELIGVQEDIDEGVPCTCRLATRACGFWHAVLDPVDSTSPIRQPLPETDDPAWDAYVTDSLLALDRAAAAASARIVIDGSKSPRRASAIHSKRSTHVLHLVRDGRALIDSMRRRERAEWSVEQIARQWVEIQASAAELRQSAGDRGMLVRYEDLCADPVGVRNSLHRWMGLDPAGPTPRRTSHHLRGSTCRFDPQPITPDDAWRERLDPDETRRFEQIAGDALESYGYLRRLELR